jgi:ATP-dependent Lhr-like helicase
MWDLVWAGEATNDTFAALRALSLPRSRSKTTPRPGRLVALGPPRAAGRWSLVAELVGEERTPTERGHALAVSVLERHGVVTREAVASESISGGYAAVYPVLRAMEESGRARRGYFVAGLGGSQFALPGALDRLRALREPPPADTEAAGVVLAATDPATPYGATLPWPSALGGKAMRAAGTHVVLVDGLLAAWMGRGEKEIVAALPEDEPRRSQVARALARGLAGWTRRTGRHGIAWTVVDGAPVGQSALAEFLKEAGFIPWGTGFRLAPQAVDLEPSVEEPVETEEVE